MIRTRFIISILLTLTTIALSSLMAFGQHVSYDHGRPLSRKAIVPLYTSPHNMAKIAAWSDSWRKELPEQGAFMGYALKGSTPWRLELYTMFKDSTYVNKLCQAMGLSDIWSDSLPTIPGGHIALVDSFASGTRVVRMVDVRDFDPSPTFYQVLGGDISTFNTFCRNQLAMVDSAVNMGQYFWGGESSLGQMMHRFQADASGCDISLWSPAHWFDSLSNGYIYLHDVERLMPYRNQLVVVTLTGEQLHRLMEQTYARRFKTMKNDQSDLLRSKTPCYLHGQFYGLAHRVDVSKNKGLKVRLNRGAEHRVAMNSFMAGRIAETIGEIEEAIRVDTLGDYRLLFTRWVSRLDQGNSSNADKANHAPSVELHPEPWVRIATARERELLYQENR